VHIRWKIIVAVFVEHASVNACGGIAAAGALDGKLNVRFEVEMWRDG
jgi:hypothetical protein